MKAIAVYFFLINKYLLKIMEDSLATLNKEKINLVKLLISLQVQKWEAMWHPAALPHLMKMTCTRVVSVYV